MSRGIFKIKVNSLRKQHIRTSQILCLYFEKTIEEIQRGMIPFLTSMEHFSVTSSEVAAYHGQVFPGAGKSSAVHQTLKIAG